MDNSPHVVLVDDDRMLVKIIAQVLTMHGMRVSSAYDGETGLHLVRESLPDLVILDIMMPRLDGFAVCQRLKSDPETSDIPVLVFSALGASELQLAHKDAAAIGADACMTKPVKVEELLDQVALLLPAQYGRGNGYETSRAFV